MSRPTSKTFIRSYTIYNSLITRCNSAIGDGVDPVRVCRSGPVDPHNKLVVRVLYGLEPYNNVTTE